MKALTLITCLLLANSGFTQTNSHLPLKSYSFDFVSVNEKENNDSLYQRVAEFYGIGEIQIYSDSVTVSWSNEWECGIYRLFVDTAFYIHEEHDGRSEWISFYGVRSKGYHQVNGSFTLIEGTDIEKGSYTDILFDTDYSEEGWAMRRRVYSDLEAID